MSQSKTLSVVCDLKLSLSRELVVYDRSKRNDTVLSSTFYNRCADILNQLDRLQIDFDILCKTLIGTVVSKFKKCPDENVSNKAKLLVKKWKLLAKKEGVSAENPSSKPSKSPERKETLSNPKNTSKETSDKILPQQWKCLATLRRNICVKLYDIFIPSNDATQVRNYTSSPNVVEVCSDIECAIQDFAEKDIMKYKEKARSLSFNLKRNSSLRSNILNGFVSPANLTSMTSEQLATQEKKASREKLEQDLQDSRRLDWDQANEDKINEMCGIKGELLNASLFTCGRCKSTKTTSTQKQTRSADEPMTVFVLCFNCGNRWKC